MFETMALPQPPGPLCRIAITILRWTRYALALEVDYARFFSRSHHAVIRVYDEAGNVIQTHERKGDFKDW